MPDEDLSLRVPLPSGPVDVDAVYARAAESWASIVLAHGAGSRHDHPFLRGFAAGMSEAGVSVLRFTFPYAQSGRRMPGPAAHAILAWRAALDAAFERADGVPVWASGKSYGGRMASMLLAEDGEATDVSGAVYLGYPLHPPGRPEAPRIAHLPQISVPQLFVEGSTDPFIDPHAQLEEAVESCQDAAIAWVEGGHSFEVKGRKRPADVIGRDLAPLVADWMRARG